MHDASIAILSDDELHVAVRRLTARANIALADLLAHLGEVEARGIHRNRACATLYTYCQYELRMSEDAAYRRAKAARLVHRHPELRDIVARGEIHLTGLLMIAPLLGGEQHDEVLERARFRSKREIARLLAELDPKPEVAARVEPIARAFSRLPPGSIAGAFAGPVRNLPAGDRPSDWMDPVGSKLAVGDAPADASSCSVDDNAPAVASSEHELDEAERSLEGAWLAARATHHDRSLRFKVQFTASQEFVELLEEAIDLLGYEKKASTLPEVQLRALRELVERLRKSKGGAGARPAPGPAAPARNTNVSESAGTENVVTPPVASKRPKPSSGRHIPAAVRRAVWARDGARCAYGDERGRRCAERRRLELHHREPYARGGLATKENLELRCRAHNTLAAEEDFGRAFVDCIRGAECAVPS